MSDEAFALSCVRPARPNPSRARRISGAKTIGTDRSKAGKVVFTSQENAGSTFKLVNRPNNASTSRTPRSKVIAWVSRSQSKMTKKTSVTKDKSITLSQFKRSKTNKRVSIRWLITLTMQLSWQPAPARAFPVPLLTWPNR
jgi:hypothetical protein